VAGFTSESRQLDFLATKQPFLEFFLSLAAGPLAQDLSARQAALDVWLRRKGILLDAQRRYQEAIFYGATPEVIAVFQNLSQVRSRISQLTFAGPNKEGFEAHAKQINELEEEKKKLEDRLASLSQAYAAKLKTERVDSRKVADALPPGSVLVEIARICPFDYHFAGPERPFLPARYLVFILPAGQPEKIHLIDLGPAEPIDQTVKQIKYILEQVKKDINELRALPNTRLTALTKRLHNQVFAPIKQAIGSAREIFISPDGQLSLLPFEILQDDDDRYLIEEYTFNYLASGRDLLGFDQASGPGGPPVIFGNPDFDLKVRPQVSPDKSQKRADGTGGQLFGPLPGTELEAVAIHQLLGVNQAEIYLKTEAREDTLRSQKAPRILHLATHGFFLSDQDYSNLVLDRQTQAPGEKVINQQAQLSMANIKNSLLRSGLALAGANNLSATDLPNQADGLMTAEKILSLNLQGTELVVLSACDTGLGEVKVGEGVYGLRRAFLQAGTKGLVMSMWQVQDKETQELMIAFYQNMIQGHMSRREALRWAALQEKDIVFQRYGHTNPVFWGAFVYLGQP
ncbi:MAG: CHAT domain-containing protein, partial [Deltaproteobacteria bacterium]|nr:CHAT domain-containing protein [Deltaproteobacteria bacterium]